MRRLGLLWSALLWSCAGDKAGTNDTASPDGNTDTGDADADADADSDTDTDTDADTDAPITMNGSVDTYHIEVATLEPVPTVFEAVCDETYTLTGSDYTGFCPGCTFAFNVNSVPDTPVSDDCPLYRIYPQYTFDVEAYYGGEYIPVLAFAPTYNSIYGFTYTNALLTGNSLWLYGPIYPVYTWTVLRSDEFDNDTFSFDGSLLRWTDDDDIVYGYNPGPYLYPIGAICPTLTATIYDPSNLVDGEVTGQGEVECTLGMYGDIWEVEVNAGDIVQVSVDTVNVADAFDPTMTVLGPDQCFTLVADENAFCSYPPPTGYKCPSGEFVAPLEGSYKIQISAYPILESCANGASGRYVLSVASPSAQLTELTPIANDLLLYDEIRQLELTYDLTVEVLP